MTHENTEQRLNAYDSSFSIAIQKSTFLYFERKKKERNLVEQSSTFMILFLRKFQSFVAFRRMKESRIRIKNRYSIETSNVGKIGWTIGWEGRMEKDGG